MARAMSFAATIQSERFVFRDLVELFAKANEEKSGDQLAGIAAPRERERVAAKLVLADVTLGEIVDTSADRLTTSPNSIASSSRSHDGSTADWRPDRRRIPRADLRRGGRNGAVRHRPGHHAGDRRRRREADGQQGPGHGREPDSECHALPQHDGRAGVLGVRVQPNHPSRRPAGILLCAVDGLLFGCGDAVIGVNPATESVETVAAILRGLDRLIETLAIPTQACCLAHITTQLACLDRGAPVDLLFQSIAGTEAANAASASPWRCCARAASACSSTTAARDVRLGRRPT